MSGRGTARLSLPFFVYGTLRPGEHHHGRCLHGRTSAEEPALLPDAVLHDGPGYPYVVEEPGGGPVHGELITALPDAYDRLLVALDLLEEYVPGDPRNLYERIARRVVRPDRTEATAWVYVAAPRVAARLRASGKVIESGDWCSRRLGTGSGTGNSAGNSAGDGTGDSAGDSAGADTEGNSRPAGR